MLNISRFTEFSLKVSVVCFCEYRVPCNITYYAYITDHHDNWMVAAAGSGRIFSEC